MVISNVCNQAYELLKLYGFLYLWGKLNYQLFTECTIQRKLGTSVLCFKNILLNAAKVRLSLCEDLNKCQLWHHYRKENCIVNIIHVPSRYVSHANLHRKVKGKTHAQKINESARYVINLS